MDNGLVSQKFAGAKEFIIRTLLSAKPCCPSEITDPSPRVYPVNDPAVWDCLSNDLKRDRDIALAAFKGEHLMLNDLPAPWNQDRDFFLETVAFKSKLWLRIPQSFQTNDSDFPRAFTSIQADDLIASVLEKNPQLSEDRQFWDMVVSTLSAPVPEDLYGLREGTCRAHNDSSRYSSLRHAPASIFADPELMAQG